MIRQFVHSRTRPWGWLLVAAGAFLIAVKETWELHEHEEWNEPGWILLTVIALLAVGFTAYRMRRSAILTMRSTS